MLEIDGKLYDIDKVICQNLDLMDSEGTDRALIAQNVLGQSRNLAEHIALKLYGGERDIDTNETNIRKAKEFIKHEHEYLFLRRFHMFLEESKSHYTPPNEDAERLFLKYYQFFLLIRELMKKKFDMNLLHNLEKFPLDTDKSIQEYRNKIAEKINNIQSIDGFTHASRLYVHKVVPFWALGKVYFEITLTPAFDTTSKFERFVCYSAKWIPSHYSVKVALSNEEISLFGKDMLVTILSYYEVSIRPCELRNYARIVGEDIDIKTNSSEYREIMRYLTNSGASLLDVVLSSDTVYQDIVAKIFKKVHVSHLRTVLDKSRELIRNNKAGSIVLRYLLHTMNNRVLKKQYANEENKQLSGLRLQHGTIPFETMPFASYLIQHIPDRSDLYESIETKGRAHELLSSYIHGNMNENSCLYTKKSEIEANYENIEYLIDIFNRKLYKDHVGREIKTFGENIYVEEAYQHTKIIIDKLYSYSQKGLHDYGVFIDSWLKTHEDLDCDEKRIILRNLFLKTRVALIYGSAGTGKTYLINLITQIFGNFKKIVLANTNPAVENLRRHISDEKSKFSTIAKFISYNTENYDILIVDECSMVSNDDMATVLTRCDYKMIILVGDTCQIESIMFGNWFSLAKSFIPKYARWELEKPYRTKDKKLLELWKRVRELKPNLTEYIVSQKYSTKLDESVFDKKSEDEIILCLNYDGLYGINNVNRLLQNSNPNEAVDWDLWTFKKGDPILFNECERFTPVLYNNLKGTIVDVKKDKERGSIWFSIEIDKQLKVNEAERAGLKLENSVTDEKSIVSFSVTRKDADDDGDNADESDIPFQIAYAVSIHKAQGLEYDSVKLIISKDTDEMITHNIFYTAVTRSKKHLKIYWSPETMTHVISNFKKNDSRNDAAIFAAQNGFRKMSSKT